MGTFLAVVGVCLLVGVGLVALMSTDAGEIGCGCGILLLWLVGVGVLALILMALFGLGCSLVLS